MFYCTSRGWLASGSNEPQEQASANPETFHGLSADTRPGLPKPLFTVHAYSIEQARAIVAARVAGETIVVGPVARDGASQ